MNIGTTIIEIRKQEQMTQEEFAKLFHVTRQTVSNWENEKSYPDIKTLIEISDKFNISLDRMLKEDMKMVKRIDNYKAYRRIFFVLVISLLIIGIFGGIYIGICSNQHKKMYDKVLEAGFTKEITEEHIEKYQGDYGLTEQGVDYRVVPKSIGRYELDNTNFMLVAHKGNNDITIIIDEHRIITLALYLNGGSAQIDEEGNIIETNKKISDKQRKEAQDLLDSRKNEIIPILNRLIELWDRVNE